MESRESHRLDRENQASFFLYMFFGEPTVHFFQFFPLSPLTEVSLQPSTIPGGNLPEGWQSAVGWGDTRFELGNSGQQSGALPLSHHASMPSNIASDIKANA
jgi:hypothetical protein